MVATVGSISIDLSTNVVKFQDGFKRAATTVDRETKRMSTSLGGLGAAANRMGNVLSGFVGGLAAGAFNSAMSALSGSIGKAKQAVAEFEEIGNRAKAAGLGTDFFQGLSFGAGQVDVEMETLNTSLKTFAKNIGLARDGSGALYSGLLKINPELLKAVLTAGDQEQRLKLVAEAMSRMNDETQKAALASAVFGRGGLDMVRVLDGGAAALDKFMATAREMGIIIPPDLIERAGELDDKMKVLTDVININFNQALVNMGPAIVAGMGHLAAFAQQVNTLSADIDRFVKNPSLQTFANVFSGDRLAAIVKSLPTTQLATAIKTVGQTFLDWANQTESTAEALDRVQTEIIKTQEYANELIDRGLKDGWEDIRDEIGLTAGKLIALREEYAKLQKQANVTERDMVLAQQRRLLENAGAPAWTSGGRPTVNRGLPNAIPAEIDDEAMDKIEAAIHGGTDETERVGRYVQDLDRNMGGYIGDLGGTFEYNFENLNDAIEVLGHRVVEMAKINESFRFDAGLGGSTGTSGSRAGRRYTIDAPGITIPLTGMPFAPQGGEQTIDEGGSGGGGGAVNVNVVVRPVMEGTRLSSQSLAELKQAASAGTEAALRTYHGR